MYSAAKSIQARTRGWRVSERLTTRLMAGAYRPSSPAAPAEGCRRRVRVKHLVQRIDHFVAAYSTKRQPFKWTATADSIHSRCCIDFAHIPAGQDTRATLIMSGNRSYLRWVRIKQQTLALAGDLNADFERFRRPTRSDRFLATMERIVPWSELCDVIEPFYPKRGNGRPPVGLDRMLRMFFVQHLFNLADQACDEALLDSSALRRFVRIDLGRDRVARRHHAAEVSPPAHAA